MHQSAIVRRCVSVYISGAGNQIKFACLERDQAPVFNISTLATVYIIEAINAAGYVWHPFFRDYQ